MFDPDKLPAIQDRIREETDSSSASFDELRSEVDALRIGGVTTIQPMNTNMISLVASDAGNNRLECDRHAASGTSS